MTVKRPHWSDKVVEDPFPELFEWLKNEFRPGWKIELGQYCPPSPLISLSLHRKDGPFVKYDGQEKCWFGMKAPLETARGFTTLKEAIWAAVHLHERQECEICIKCLDWNLHFEDKHV